MQKVEGSSPFSRLEKSPAQAGFFAEQDARAEVETGFLSRNFVTEHRSKRERVQSHGHPPTSACLASSSEAWPPGSACAFHTKPQDSQLAPSAGPAFLAFRDP